MFYQLRRSHISVKCLAIRLWTVCFCRYPELSLDLPTGDSLSGERLIVEATAIPGSFKVIVCDGCHEEIHGALTSIANRARVSPKRDRSAGTHSRS